MSKFFYKVKNLCFLDKCEEFLYSSIPYSIPYT
jgi:hypothetical protein